MPSRRRLLVTGLALAALVVSGCGGEGEIPDLRADGAYDGAAPTAPAGALPTEGRTAILTSSERPTETPATDATAEATESSIESTPTPTASPTAEPTETEATEEPAVDGGDDGQTYALDPAGPVTIDDGDTVEVTFGDRYDDGEMPPAIDVILVVCEDVELRDGELRFIDANDEGTADGRLSDASRAAIVGLNGTDVSARASVTDLLLRNGEASVTVEPNECVWVVFFTDRDGDGELKVDGDDLPEEVFGATRLDLG